MTLALVLVCALGWSWWYVVSRPPGTTPAQDTDKRAPAGLEDDGEQLGAVVNAWTALDERQLIRLLSDSAP